MHLLIEIVLLAGAAFLFVLVVFLLLQIVMAVVSSAPTSINDGVRPRLAVVIPAHDESTGLLPTLLSLLPQLRRGDRCVVIADNCSDDTAQVAAQAGVEVVERFDPTLRGKGYALDFGIRGLAADPPEVVVVVDADCILSEGSLERIAVLSHKRMLPVQALYVMAAPKAAVGMSLIAEFAGRVKNGARCLGSHRLGLPCPLMGTGMALPWGLLDRVDLASGHIVEDAMLSIDFMKAGYPPQFCHEASVITTLPANTEGSNSQRTRWEHGNLSMIFGVLPRLLLQGIRQASWKQVGLAIDLLIPPLALLVMIVFAHFALCALVALFGGPVAPLVLMTLVVTAMVTAVGLSWMRYGRDIVRPQMLLLAPLYALRKLPLYLKFLTGRQTEWVRSKRDAG